MPVVTFLSDFGLRDEFVGICHAVIVQICPDAQVIHLSHGIEPQAIDQGALALAAAIRYTPPGVHLAVVDPGVGSERRALVLESGDGRRFVGPDNGLLLPATDACGGVARAVEITSERYMLTPVSRTFHGRDVFSPVAGHLAAGVDPAALGPQVDPAGLVRRLRPGHTLTGSLLAATVLEVDRFGNIRLSVTPGDLGELFQPGRTVEVDPGTGSRYYALCARTFADVDPGEFVVFEDASGFVSVAVNRGDAAKLIDVEHGRRVQIEFAPSFAWA
jgi:S-adenosyl-L-methionine hydrolase (adenosine-forming)